MYLRFGWVVANVGWLGSLVIVTLATSITLLTSLSISAIATDRVVRVGGAYYMISRSLGIETGGAVGIPLYFAQALSVALYTLGFAESLSNSFPVLEDYQTPIALITTVVVAGLAIQSADLAIRAQYFIMGAIALSLLSLVFGGPVAESDIGMWNVTGRVGEPFWAVFAVFFPAVTGIMAGVNMSGDLKNPSKSIPVGTLAAVGTGYVIYMVLPLFLATRADYTALTENPLVMRDMAIWGDAILLGVWGATLSSALGSVLGAPRVLQALARDGVLPPILRWLGQGKGETDEPRLGTFLTLGVALAAVSLGDLNLIAPVLTMFFLSTYLVLNAAAAIEGFLESPSFRPTFGVPWYLSALGAIGCLWVMLLINPVAAVVAAVLVLGVYLWLERRELQTAWGDVRRGLWVELARMAILSMGDDADTKNWRPHMLVLSGAPMRRWALVELATALTHNRGMVTISSVLPSGSRDMGQQAKLESKIREYLEKRGVQALVRLVTAPDPFVGAERLVEAYGIGPLVPNTIFLGDSEQEHLRHDYCRLIAKLYQSRRSIIIFRENAEREFGQRRRIDVWWGGLQANGGLMLLLAYLLRTSNQWRGAEIFLKLVVPNEMAAQAARLNLEDMADRLRIGAKTQVIIADGRPFPEILKESSASADLVCLGIAKPDKDMEEFAEYYGRLQKMASGLPTTLFVLAAEGTSFEDVLQQDTPQVRR
ncbi:Na-K-Cl cotransporter [Phormidium yuhuli AB48]|uniref:Na-K-Cl cotransporter n=2 Tax=Phormidium TaxID=1198 RepID=A0ABY5AV70_9CYAN|nr:Na-K-Cl cotransporter [Phormidium yuhuli]USR93132.1 Na-K-Cl cotransporter [Phormidium yuhuli AB48]